MQLYNLLPLALYTGDTNIRFTVSYRISLLTSVHIDHCPCFIIIINQIFSH